MFNCVLDAPLSKYKPIINDSKPNIVNYTLVSDMQHLFR